MLKWLIINKPKQEKENKTPNYFRTPSHAICQNKFHTDSKMNQFKVKSRNNKLCLMNEKAHPNPKRKSKLQRKLLS